jgi:hypothetical protein
MNQRPLWNYNSALAEVKKNKDVVICLTGSATEFQQVSVKLDYGKKRDYSKE